MKNKFKIIFVLVFIGGIVYLIYNFINNFKVMSPFINKTFDKYENIIENQKLVDSFIILYKVKDKNSLKISFNSLDTIDLHFFTTKKSIFIDGVEDVYSSINLNSNYKLIIDDSICSDISDKLRDELFYLKNDPPFEFKSFTYPYSIRISNGEILKASTNIFYDNE